MPDYDYKKLEIIEPDEPETLFKIVDDEGNEIYRIVDAPSNKSDRRKDALAAKHIRLMIIFVKEIANDKRVPEERQRWAQLIMEELENKE